MRLVAFLEVSMHWGGCEVESKGACDNVHCWLMDVSDDQVPVKLCVEHGAGVGKIGPEMMHYADGLAGSDDCLDLAERISFASLRISLVL